MCFGKCVLNFGEKIFNVLVVLAIIAGVATGVVTGIAVGGKSGIIAGVLQLIISWACTLIVSLIVYSLLDIRRSLSSCNAESKCCDKDSSCTK